MAACKRLAILRCWPSLRFSRQRRPAEIVRRVVAYSVITCLLATASACTRAINYTLPTEPRYAGSEAALPDSDAAVRVVTFNVAFGEHIPEAIGLLRGDPALRDADVIFLQEMDEPGVRRIAEALKMSWVYYPAVVHPHSGRDFGNAILSRWPIRGDRKIILPHRAAIGKSQRIAVTGTVTIRGTEVALYSIHLGVPILTGRRALREQAQTVIDDVGTGPDHVIIAGDLNWQSNGEVFERARFAWPTRGLGRTVKGFDVDHIFTRGFRAAAVPPAGVVKDNRGASDHRPVWGVFVADSLPAPARLVEALWDESTGIKKAAWIDSTLMRGGRPGEDGLAALGLLGFRTVVNLTNDDDERREAERLGLDYVEIPLTAHLWSSPPTEAQVREFFDLVLDPDRRPLFFHCKQGVDRTGMMAALYRMEVDGWPAVDAVREMQDFGYHDWFDDPIDYVRGYLRRGYAHTTSSEESRSVETQ